MNLIIEEKRTNNIVERETYFDLKECTEEELEELSERLFYDILFGEKDYSDVLSEDEIESVFKYDCHKIPFSILEKVYGGICFVNEDFFCNCE